MTAAVSDETDDEGTGVPGMKHSHQFRTREASNPNDWLRTRRLPSLFPSFTRKGAGFSPLTHKMRLVA